MSGWKAEKSGLLSAQRTVHPLPKGPKGEGWGEGKQTTARHNGHVLDLSCGRCPQLSFRLFTVKPVKQFPGGVAKIEERFTLFGDEKRLFAEIFSFGAAAWVRDAMATSATKRVDLQRAPLMRTDGLKIVD